MSPGDVIIVGGGVTGTALASLLVARRVSSGRITVLVPPPPAAALPAPLPAGEWDLRVFALSRASQRLLTLAGAWQRLPADKVSAYDRMSVWDASGEPGGRGSLSFDCAELGEPNLGFIVEGRALQSASRAAALAAGAVFIEAGIASLQAEAAALRVRLSDGRDLEGQLLIVADGAGSPTRRLLGIETAGHAYHQDALVAHVRTAQPHRRTAWQRFLPGGPLAFLPLPDGRSSIVWSVRVEEARRLRALGPEAFGEALTAASGEFLGACELTTPVASFPLKLEYAVTYLGTRAVLVGDAAHAVHPLAGQGLNLGLLDCAALLEVLEEGGADLGAAQGLRRYERWRRSENLLAAGAFDALERLFASGHPAVAQLRVAGLGAVRRLPFLTREFASRAMGLSGDLPKFLRAAPGEP